LRERGEAGDARKRGMQGRERDAWRECAHPVLNMKHIKTTWGIEEMLGNFSISTISCRV
jgi:hypothetical protein